MYLVFRGVIIWHIDLNRQRILIYAIESSNISYITAKEKQSYYRLHWSEYPAILGQIWMQEKWEKNASHISDKKS